MAGMSPPPGHGDSADRRRPERWSTPWVFLAAALACFPVAMLVAGVATGSVRWMVAALPAAVFFAAGLRVSWLRAQTFVELFDGSDESVARHDAARAIGWTLVALAGLTTCVVVLNLPFG